MILVHFLDRMISTNQKYEVYEYALGAYTVRSRLKIRNFGPADVGIYNCVCKNFLSSNKGVKGKVNIQMKSGKQHKEFICE